MNARSLKEKAVLAMLGVVVLYAVAVASWFMHFDHAWRQAATKYERAKKTCQKEAKTIGERRKWELRYEEELAAMPAFETGKSTETTWMRKVDEVAAKNLIVIGLHKPQKEIDADGVKELPIEVSRCEGSLEAFVRFMHELENSDEGLFAISQMRLKPSSKKGYLSGDFTLNCAYMRE